MNKVQFKDQQLNKVYEDKLEELRKLTDTPVQNTAYLWDKTVERYASNVERVKRIFQTDEMKSYVTTKLLRDMDMFLRRCHGNPCEFQAPLRRADRISWAYHGIQ